MKSIELKKLLRQEIRSLLRENITPQSSPQELLDYGNKMRAELQAKIEDGMKTVRLQIKPAKRDSEAGSVRTYTINGQQVQTMEGQQLQLFKVNFPRIKQMIVAHTAIPSFINGMLYYMSKGDQANTKNQYDKLMALVREQGL